MKKGKGLILINLDESLFLGRGGERSCYKHPHDERKVIKVIFQKGKHNNQNQLDYEYFKFLEKNEVEFSRITRCYSWVDTNLGKGLEFERVNNIDNTKLRTLSFYIKHNIFTKQYDLMLINELREYIFKNEILFVDASLSNVFCQKLGKEDYKLIIFDGLGARRTGLKFKLYLMSRIFRKYKIRKQWRRFIYNYNREKSLNLPIKKEDVNNY